LRLRYAPLIKSQCPLLSAPHVERFMAGFNHTAVDGSSDYRRNISGCDRHHRFVEQGYAGAEIAHSNLRAALRMQRERDQVFVLESLANGSGAAEHFQGNGRLAGVKRAQPVRYEHISMLQTLGLSFEQSASPSQPTTGLSRFAAEEQAHAEPYGAA